MNTFEWSVAREVANAGAGTEPVAAAMRSRTGTPPADAAILKAGGIDVLDLMKEGLLTPRRIVNLRDLRELARIEEVAGGALRIGSMATLAQLAAHPLVRERHAALAEAAAQSASPQIRNVATVGGNLLQRPRCWYFRSLHHHCLRKGGTTCFAFAGENQHHAVFAHQGCAIVHPSSIATPLVAFDAAVDLAGAKSGRRTVALEAFFKGTTEDLRRENDLQSGEILTAVVLAAPKPGTVSAYLRQGELDSFDWPAAEAAAVLELGADRVCRRASLVLGAAAPVPYRVRQAESALAGQSVSETVARTAANAALAGAAPLSANAYKLPMLEALSRRAILAAAGRR